MKSQSDRVTLREFVRYLGKTIAQVWSKHPVLATFWSLLFLLAAVVPILQVPLQKNSIDGITRLQNGDGAFSYVMMLVAGVYLLPMVGSLVGLFQGQANVILKQSVTYEFKRRLAERAVRAPYMSFEDTAFYDRLNLAQMAISYNAVQIVESVFLLVSYGISLAGLFGILFVTHWALPFAMVLSAVPGMMLLIWVKKSSYRVNVQSSPLNREAEYVYKLLLRRESAKEIRLYHAKSFLMERWSVLFWQLREIMLKQNMQSGTVQLAGGLLLTIATACFALILVYFVAHRQVTLGDYVALTGAVVSVQTILGSISSKVGSLFELGLYLKNLYTFLEEQDINEREGTLPFPADWEELRVDNLTFRYPTNDRDVLEDVSFAIKRGEKIAIVGENGSGKTTLVHCLLGLYPPTEGHVYYGSAPLHSLEKQSFHTHVAAVFQDFYRYHFSVADNVAIGDWAAREDEARLNQVLEQVNLQELTAKLPQGLRTNLGRELGMGVELSGGQWQRIAIARAFMRDADLLVLDEPTSALDPYAEMEIFEQFNQLTAGKTAIMISHRLGPTRYADRILVMKNGRLVEMGSQTELLELNGEYANMYKSQASWYQEVTRLDEFTEKEVVM